MTMMARVAVATALLGGVSACEGVPRVPDLPSQFEVLDTLNGDLHEAYGEVEVTDVENMPVTGTAIYEGAAYFVEGEVAEIDGDDRSNATMVSRMSMDVDFSGEGSFEGEFTDFASADPDVEDIDGYLSMTDGRLQGYTFDANLDGSITSSQGTRLVEGALGGVFVGDRAEAISGLIEADLTEVETDTSSVISGSFVAIEN